MAVGRVGGELGRSQAQLCHVPREHRATFPDALDTDGALATDARAIGECGSVYAHAVAFADDHGTHGSGLRSGTGGAHAAVDDDRLATPVAPTLRPEAIRPDLDAVVDVPIDRAEAQDGGIPARSPEARRGADVLVATTEGDLPSVAARRQEGLRAGDGAGHDRAASGGDGRQEPPPGDRPACLVRHRTLPSVHGARLLWSRCPQTTLALVLAGLIVAIGASAGLAAKGDRQKGRADDERPAAEPAVITSLKGDAFRMAKAKVAQRVIRIADAAGDQVTTAGTPADGAPGYADIEAVYLAPIRVPRKLLTRMADDYPRGAAGAFYGAGEGLAALDRALFVAVDLADERPSGQVQQVEVGLDGDGARPLQVGSATDSRAGIERFSLSGIFSNGAQASGTTDLSGLGPGDPIDYHNAPSGLFGFYDERADRYYVVMPMSGETESATVTLRTMTDAGEVLDRLELPGGGHLVNVADPGGGFDPTAGSEALACRSIETFTAASGVIGLADPGATIIRYAAGVDPTIPLPEAAAVLGALDAAGTTIPMALQPVDGDGEAITVDGELSRAPALNAFTLTMEVPAGRWTFAPSDGAELRTPAGERLIDPASLIGRAGVLTGEGLEGFVSGDPTCARWALDEQVCGLVSPDDMAALVGRGSADIEQTTVTRADGSEWCVGIVPGTGEAQYIVRVGSDYVTASELERRVGETMGDTSAGGAGPGGASVEGSCASQSLEVGAAGLTLDCGAAGFERHAFVVIPEATAASDPEAGLLVSIDMLVDGELPFGQRYDTAAAMGLFEGLASDLGAAARP